MQARILCFGEILFDIYPAYKRLGGAPFNFACHLHRFGHEVIFVTRIGADENGGEIMAALLRLGFPVKHIQTDAVHPTGTVRVALNENAVPEFTIVEDAAYDFIAFDDSLRNAIGSHLDLIYFGTLAQRHPRSRETLRAILQSKSQAALTFYDVNLRQSFYTPEILADSLLQSKVVKLNHDELKRLREMFGLAQDENRAATELIQRFDLEGICLTKGEKGSTWFASAEQMEWSTVARDNLSVIDTVGAGDGYAAVLAHGLLCQWPIAETGQRASRFAAAICSLPGAIPEEVDFYRQHAPWAELSGQLRPA